jgi:hypothetical protein
MSPASLSSIPLLFFFALSSFFAFAEQTGRIRSVSITADNLVRLVIDAPAAGNQLVLESADAPQGPWRKEAEVSSKAVAVGLEFLTPHHAYLRQKYYRFSLFSFSPVAAQGLPYIRYLAPNTKIFPGQFVTLFGANFAPNPSDNTVTFQLPTNSWNVTVTQAATNYLIVRVPTNLVADAIGTNTYRVTVTTSAGTGNGVSAEVQKSFENFIIRPESPIIAQQPPGSGTVTLVVGGGTPPYKLFPLSAADQKNATVTLDGPVLQVTATTNAHFAYVRVGVEDSSTDFRRSTSASIEITTVPYEPKFSAEFHTLLAGTEPGANLTATLSQSVNGNFFTEKLELELQNLGLDLSHLHLGEIAGLLQLFDPGGPYYYTFQHLRINELSAGKASFEIISEEDGGEAIVGQGEFIQDPPAIVINVLNLPPAVLVSQPLTLKLVLADQIFQLPATVGANFSVVAHFSSVSTREDVYAPQNAAITNTFTTTGLADGSPRIERLLPMEGEIYRNVTLHGSNFPTAPLPSNAVTFAAVGGTRVAAKVTVDGKGDLVVPVPRTAITGPVRVNLGDKVSNDFLFGVRFRPDTTLLLDNFIPNTPTTLQALLQQPQDEHETADEIPVQTILCTLGGGHIAISNLSSNQQVGTVTVINTYTDRRSTNALVYIGKEPTGAERHIFQVRIPGNSSFVLGTLYYSESSDGVTLEIDSGEGLFQFAAGIVQLFQFSVPIYVPGADTQVPIRVEAISRRWTSIPGNEMHVIWNRIQSAQ